MSKPDTNSTGPHVAAQVAAKWTATDAAYRGEQLAKALREMARVREFVGSQESILGNPNTKHGEIAEQLTVYVRRAWDAFEGRTPTATFDGVGRTDPVDYIKDGLTIQSKYYNGLRNTLDGVLKHIRDNPDHPIGSYDIPADQRQQLNELWETGRIDGLSGKSIKAIQRKLGEIRQEREISLEKLIQRGEGTYDEVQKGRIHDTIRDREDKFRQEAGPSLAGLGKATGVAAAVGGGLRLTQAFYAKYREGKNPFRGEFSSEDWKDVGIITAKGTGESAVSGATLYLLTNWSDLPAPFAGAFVSGLIGVGELLGQYHTGEIDAEQFVDLSHIVASDAAIIGLASAAGQILIPAPVLGAIVGSIAGKFVASAIKGALGEAEAALIERLAAYERNALEQLDDEFRQYIQRLDIYFGNLEHFAQLAFDETVNTTLRLEASIQYAQIMGVTDNLVLHTPSELDTFMTE